jgi:hypothetical protein
MIDVSHRTLGNHFATRAGRSVACAIALSILLGGGTRAAEESPTSDVPRLSAEEILKRNAAARGGVDAWRNIKTMVQIGRIERLGNVPGAAARSSRAAQLTPDANQSVGFRVEMARPNKLRYELTYQGITAIQAFDGRDGFTVQPGAAGAVARPFSEVQARALADQFEIEGPLLSASEKGTVVAVEGVDVLRGQPAYRLSLTTRGGIARHAWVDAHSFLDVQLDGARQIGDRAWPITTVFADFRKVGGVQVPYQIETAVSGVNAMERVQLSKVVLNAPLEDSLFILPRAPAPAPGDGGGTRDTKIARDENGARATGVGYGRSKTK